MQEAVAAFEAIFQSEGLSVQVRVVPGETNVRFLTVSEAGWLPYWDTWFDVSSDSFSGSYMARVNLMNGEVHLGPDLHVRGLNGRWQRQSGVIEYRLVPGGQ